MGTTAQKLNKILETKEAIRTAINNKGGTLTTTDTFASYPSAIDSLPSGGNDWLKEYLDETKTAVCLFSGRAYLSYGTYTAWNDLTYERLQKILSYNTTSSVDNMKGMFYYCDKLTTIPLINTSLVTNMSSMFNNCLKLTTIPQLDTSKVQFMGSMFSNCPKLTTIPLLDTSSCTDMGYMFEYCSTLTTIPQLNTSKVKYMNGMFSNCVELTTIPQLDTSSVTSMTNLFNPCKKLTTIPQLNTSSCTSLDRTFANCYKLTTIDITHMKITSTSFSNAFAGNCYSLTKFIIRNMDTIPSLNSNAFDNCYHFTGTVNADYNPQGLKDGRIYVPDDKVEELKAATNWSVYADIIVPLSTLVE